MPESNSKATTANFQRTGDRYRLVLSGLIPLAAFGLQFVFWDAIQPYVWFLFFPAVFFSSWVGGLRGGLLATVLSVGLVWYFFIPPQFSFGIERPMSFFSIGMFVLMGVLFSYLHERLRQAKQLAVAAARRESENQFGAIFEQAAVGMAQVGLDGRWLRVNQRLCDIVGYTREELAPKTFQDITHPDDLKTDLALVGQVLAGELQTYTLEKRYLRKDRSIVAANLTVSLVRDAFGQPAYFISVVEDITVRKRAEAAAAQLAAIVQSSDDAIIGKNLEGIVTSWNAGAEKVFGYAAGEMIGGSITRIIPPDRLDDEKIILDRIKRGESVQHFETVRVNKAGGLIDVSVTVSPIKNAGGEVVGASKVVRDITKRKQAEAALRESEERFRTLVETAPEAVFIQTNGCFAYANAAALRLFGASQPAELLGQPVISRIHPDYQAGVLERIRTINEQRQRASSGDTVFITLDGSARHVIPSGVPFKYQNQNGALVFAVDITERKRAEQALHESERLLRSIIDVVPHFIFVKDSHSRHLLVNRACAAANGMTVEQMVGKSDFDFVADRAQAEAFMQADRKVIASGQPKLIAEEHFTNAAGQARIFQTIKIPFAGANDGEPGLLGVSVDITDLKNAETARQISRQRLQAALASMTDAVFISDAAGQFIDFNDAFATFHRFKNKAECLKTFAEYPDILDVFLPNGKLAPVEMWAVPRALRGECVQNAEYSLRRKDTGETWVGSYSFSPIRDPAGVIVGSVVVGRDITELKQAEAALRESEEKFSQIFDFSPVAISLTAQKEGRYVAVNAAWLKLYEWSREEVVGRTVVELNIWEDLKQRAVFFARLQENGSVQNVEMALRAKSGRIVQILWSGVQVVIGGESCLLGSALDITAWKQAEAAQRASDERMGLATEATGVGIWDWNVLTNKIRWNAQMFRIYGVTPTPDGFVDYTVWSGAVLPEELAQQEAILQETARRGGRNSREFRILRRDDRECRNIEAVETVRLNDRGQTEWVVGTNLDVTERKQAEEKIKRTVADLERSNQELEHFAYVASHDLQEPLRMVSSYTQLLAHHYESQLDDKARKYIHYAVDGSVRMQTLINDLLTYSRVGRRGKPLEPTDAHAVLGEALRNLAAAIVETHAVITNDELPTVLADASQLVLVFQNLLANAIKFRRAELPRIHVSARERGGEWLFAVKDNGIGIEAQYAERVFIIFQRLHTKEEYPGTGIGLAVCQRIVERHGGKIWFESAPGSGTTFLFTVPKCL